MKIFVEKTTTNFAIRNAETSELIVVRPCINSCADFIKRRFGVMGGFGKHPVSGARIRNGIIPDKVCLDMLPVASSITAAWEIDPKI